MSARTYWKGKTAIVIAILAVFCAAGLPASRAAAQGYASPGEEVIHEYASSIVVGEDGALDVTETIYVTAAHVAIIHGIYRDFPTKYKDAYGNEYDVRFTLISAGQDGIPQDYHTETRSNGVRIYIGKSDAAVDVGEHYYDVHYRVERELGFFNDHDELYWNVTGNGWSFPIEYSVATVFLPRAIDLASTTAIAYTGPAGAQGKDYSAAIFELDGRKGWGFETTKGLNPSEGLTIAVSFPKGFVQKPTAAREVIYFLEDNASVEVVLGGCIALLFFYLWAWRKYGRDPKGGVVIAQYEPPDGLSPAGMRYLAREGYDKKTMIALLIELARRGYLKIAEKKGGYTLEATEKDASDLKGEELVLLKHIFAERKIIEVGKYDKGVAEILRKAESSLKALLSVTFGKEYFSLNRTYFSIGLVASILIVGASIRLVSGAGTPGAFVAIGLAAWTTGIAFLVMKGVLAWKAVLSGMTSMLGLSILYTIVAVPLIVMEILQFIAARELVGYGYVAVVSALALINAVFYYLLPRRTELGQKLMDRVNGFKLFLEVTEKDRMNFANPPERTPELFEKYLPYALALGVEHQWAEQFASVFKEKGNENYHPAWYQGAMSGAFSTTSFASSVGGSLASSISSSTTAPGSSSGAGGGGGSGGGGGGGGGGGW